MNSFEEKFFQKYVPEGQEIKGIIHEHWINIVDNLFLWLLMGAFIPSFMYYYSERIRDMIPFYIFEGFLILIFIKIIYEIFNWYNDVFIITNKGIIDLDWALIKTKMKSVEYQDMEGIEVEQNSIMDKLLNKGDIIVFKIGDDDFRLQSAIMPYKAVDKIEEYRGEYEGQKIEKEDHFDVIMDALGGVVENYLEEKGGVKKIRDDNGEDIIEKIKEIKGTIDLR